MMREHCAHVLTGVHGKRTKKIPVTTAGADHAVPQPPRRPVQQRFI
jgi:hypothetical protein